MRTQGGLWLGVGSGLVGLQWKRAFQEKDSSRWGSLEGDGPEGGRRPWPCNSGYPEQDTAKILLVGHTENEVYRSSQNEMHEAILPKFLFPSK